MCEFNFIKVLSHMCDRMGVCGLRDIWRNKEIHKMYPLLRKLDLKIYVKSTTRKGDTMHFISQLYLKVSKSR